MGKVQEWFINNWISIVIELAVAGFIAWYSVGQIRQFKENALEKFNAGTQELKLAYDESTAFAKTQAAKIDSLTTEINELTSAVKTVMGVTAEELVENREEVAGKLAEGGKGAIEGGKEAFSKWLNKKGDDPDKEQ